MRSVEKGELAQLKAELRAVELGYVVARPLTPTRYDLLVDFGSHIDRVQVKYANGVSSKTPNSVIASLNYTDRSKTEHTYSESDVDAFVIYVPRVNEVLFIPGNMGCGKSKLQIRVAGGRRSNGIWWEDYIWN